MEDAPKVKAGRFFAEFAVRMVAFWIDLFVIAFVSQVIKDHVLVPVGLGTDGIGAVVPFVGFLYFVASWASPLRATPVQWLFRIRVVSPVGETLSPLRASLRAMALFGLFFATFLFLGALGSAFYGALALAGYAALFLAAVTPNRQAAHDLLAGSVVVNKAAVKSFHEIDAQRRPTVLKMIIDGLIFAAPVIAMLFVADMQRQRDLVYRTNYALAATQDLKTAVSLYQAAEQRWPGNALQLGTATRGDYPDGGFYELEENGVIRISFEVKPELVSGTIVQTPRISEDGVTWECHQEGHISPSHLPSACREK